MVLSYGVLQLSLLFLQTGLLFQEPAHVELDLWSNIAVTLELAFSSSQIDGRNAYRLVSVLDSSKPGLQGQGV